MVFTDNTNKNEESPNTPQQTSQDIQQDDSSQNTSQPAQDQPYEDSEEKKEVEQKLQSGKDDDFVNKADDIGQ